MAIMLIAEVIRLKLKGLMVPMDFTLRLVSCVFSRKGRFTD